MKQSDGLSVKKVDRLSATQVRLSLEFESDVVAKEQNRTANRYSQAAKIDGFRPGKAPLNIVKKKYRDQIQKDVLSNLLEWGVSQALEQTNLRPVNRPSVKFDKAPGEEKQPFSFEAEFEVQPEIELRDYKGVPLTPQETQASEEEIQQTIDELRERLASLEPTEQENPEKGLFGIVEIGYQVKGSEKVEEPKPFTVELGAGNLLQELEDALLSMKVGEQKTVEAKFPEDFSTADLAGKEATFDCKLVELKKKVLPELDDTFASQLKENSTLEQLKADIKENLEMRKAEENKKNQRKEITDFLIANHTFDVPQSLVDQQSHSLLQWMKDDMQRKGMKQMPQLGQEQLDEVKKRAEQMVRSSLLLREIALKEKIELDQSLLNQRVEAVAAQINKSVEEARQLMLERGVMQQIQDEVITDQVFDFLISNGKTLATKPKAPKRDKGS